MAARFFWSIHVSGINTAGKAWGEKIPQNNRKSKQKKRWKAEFPLVSYFGAMIDSVMSESTGDKSVC